MVKKIRNFFKKNFLLTASLMFLVVFSGTMQLFAADPPPPVGGYPAGTVLDPGCTPGSVDCIVAQAVYNAGDIVYDNSTSGLTAIDTQAAIDEIAAATIGSGFTIDLNSNMFAGTNAGSSLTTGTENLFIGINAGQAITTSIRNIAIGKDTLYNFVDSADGYGRNIAIGNEVLFNNIASYNIGIGDRSLYHNNLGSRNNAVGVYALGNNTTGHDNTAMGIYTMQNNTTGSYNTGLGDEALFYNQTGDFNTGIGMGALEYVQGSRNVGLGHFAGLNETGSDTFYIYNGVHYNLTVAEDRDYSLMYGTFNANPALQTLRINASFGIGAAPAYKFSVTDTSTNGVIGSFTNSDGTCTLDPGDVTGWSCPSDENLKKDISNLEVGLNELNQLRPVTYRLRNEDESVDLSMGLIAQEVEPIFPKLVKTQKDGTLALNYGGLTPVMIKAIQELDLKVEDLIIEKQNLFNNLVAWFGNVGNGITDFFANRIRTREICISDETGETCISKSQLDQILTNSGTVGSAPVVSGDANTDSGESVSETETGIAINTNTEGNSEGADDVNMAPTEGGETETVVPPTE